MSSPKLVKGFITDLSEMSVKDIIEHMFNGMEAQKWERAGRDFGDDGPGSFSCRYSDELGRKCAAGQLMCDETLKEIKSLSMNTSGIARLVDEGMVIPHTLPTEKNHRIEIIRIFQNIHDRKYSIVDETDRQMRRSAFIMRAEMYEWFPPSVENNSSPTS